MGDIKEHEPVLLITAAFSRHDDARQWARERAERDWGPIALASELFDFSETRFYETSMGPGIKKELWAFERLVNPAQLVELKHTANDWELEFRRLDRCSEPRPLNLDPGYLTEAKLVLATTKDRDHRLYLDRGIYAEVTLVFQGHAWQVRPWTYPDYRRADYHQFFTRCRDYLRQRYGRLVPRRQSDNA
jgi:hypothetical protein